MQHVYETLYTFDANWNVAPMLAESMPKISNRRHGLHHRAAQGRQAAQRPRDELRRRGRLAQALDGQSPRGKAVGKEIESLEAKGPNTIVIMLNRPYAPLLAQLALPNGMAAIMAKESMATPLKEFVGTGPYKFKERKPDQYVLLVRFDGYSARKEPANGYGGKREALLDELRFVPVPNANTRVEGALSGQYHYADLLPVEAFCAAGERAANVVPLLTAPFGFPYLVLNTKEGALAKQARAPGRAGGAGRGRDAGRRLRRPGFFIVEGNHYPKGTPFYSTAGTEQLQQARRQEGRGAGPAADTTARRSGSSPAGSTTSTTTWR